MPGPKRQPTKLKLIRGNPGHRTLPAGEVDPGGAPEMPLFLTDEGKVYWAQVAPPLIAAGIVTSVDGEILGQYAEALALFDRLNRQVQHRELIAQGGRYAEGEVGEDGKPQRICIKEPRLSKHPLLPALSQARNDVLKLARELGCTPSARAHIAAPGKAQAANAYQRAIGLTG